MEVIFIVSFICLMCLLHLSHTLKQDHHTMPEIGESPQSFTFKHVLQLHLQHFRSELGVRSCPQYNERGQCAKSGPDLSSSKNCQTQSAAA